MPSIRRSARFPAPVALPLDELRHVARHLSEKQAHRDVGESEREREGENDGGECDEYGHLHSLDSKRPAEAGTLPWWISSLMFRFRRVSASH